MPALVNARFLVPVFYALPLSRFRPTGPAPLRPRLRRSGRRSRCWPGQQAQRTGRCLGLDPGQGTRRGRGRRARWYLAGRALQG
jgi:hypothetical protein